jgi:N-acetylglucosamine-6-phosphate deacetylase
VPVGETSPVDVVVQDGTVLSIGPAGTGPVDIGSPDTHIGAPLFDIQVNGAFGINLQGRDARAEDIRALCDQLAAVGISHWIPTLITGSFEDTLHGCQIVTEARRDPTVRRAVPGVHLEGPYISPKDGPRGAHPRAHVRRPDIAEFDRWLEAAEGQIAYTTVAPEVPGAFDFIRQVTARGVVVSLGHHAASADDVADAVEAGACLCTHLGNGLASSIHRHENPLWPQLAEDRLTASLIADLEHLPAPMLKTLVRAKGAERVILTSDCVHIAGLPPGRYSLTGSDVELTDTGRIRVIGTDMLGGSALMLLQGVINATRVADLTLAQAYASATTIPETLFALNNRCAPLRPGAPADLLAFTIDQTTPRWTAQIQAVYIEGKRLQQDIASG